MLRPLPHLIVADTRHRHRLRPHRTYTPCTTAYNSPATARHHWSRYATGHHLEDMTSNPPRNTTATDPTQLTTPTHHFEMRFTSTPRGARLARRLCAGRLDAWGIPYGTDTHDALTLIAAELCANAVQHGHVPGRDFHLQLSAHDRTVRIEVTDTRAERLPTPAADDPTGAQTNGRGLLLVAALADLWGWHPRPDSPGKTVWAQLTIPATSTTTSQRPSSAGGNAAPTTATALSVYAG
jgi:anti-sigma regulatory factor (Ser/Thr protein kinase)